jgi:hypothetical protein
MGRVVPTEFSGVGTPVIELGPDQLTVLTIPLVADGLNGFALRRKKRGGHK